MTAPAPIASSGPAVITDLLADLDTETEITPMHDIVMIPGHVEVHIGWTGDAPEQTYYLIYPAYMKGEPMPNICERHGVQRFNYNSKRDKYECVKCTQKGK